MRYKASPTNDAMCLCSYIIIIIIIITVTAIGSSPGGSGTR
jgi:hypothetical protein